MRREHLSRGFTLIEMIVAITLLAILSAAAAVFLRGPIAGYFDTERRSDLLDTGTLALAKLGQEVANAVPNSVRVAVVGGRTYIELLPVRLNGAGVPSVGRYRIGGPGNVLSFGVPDTGFDVLGFPVEVQTGDWVVINNYQPAADVWAGNSRTAYTGPTGNVLTVSMASHSFASDGPDHRFHIATRPVTYLCDPAAGTLRRVTNYGNPSAVQPTTFGGAVQNDLLARNVLACRAQAYPGSLRRAQLLAVEIDFGSAGERLNLVRMMAVETLP